MLIVLDFILNISKSAAKIQISFELRVMSYEFFWKTIYFLTLFVYDNGFLDLIKLPYICTFIVMLQDFFV